MRNNKPQYDRYGLKPLVFTVCFSLFSFSVGAQTTVKLDDRDSYAQQAQAQFNSRNLEGAKRIVDEGLKKYPKDSDLKMLSGKYYHEKKQFDKARYDLVKALEQNPGNVDAKQILVNVEMESKRYSSAICYVNELLEVNPYWKGLWRKKIELYELQGNHVEANRLRTRIAQIYPQDTKLKDEYLNRSKEVATQQRQAGNIDDAIEIRKSIVKAEPTDPNSYLALVNDYLVAGDYNNAMVYTERGLNQFPRNMPLINKKTGMLAEQKRYNELLAFLQQKINAGAGGNLRQQYNSYLLDAARNSKDQDPSILYGKILDANPGNTEAFTYVFNHAVGVQQYEEALHILSKYRRARGGSKDLSLKELMVYNRSGNTARANSLTKELFSQYANDSDLKAAYVKIVLSEAKAKMADENYAAAIEDWFTVSRYGDSEMHSLAQTNIYNAYLALEDFTSAQNVLSEIISSDPTNAELQLKRADTYVKMKRYTMALTSYERALELAGAQQKASYLNGYGELLSVLIKDLNEQFRYEEALEYATRWMATDPFSKLALQSAINLSHKIKDEGRMISYAEKGIELFPDDVFFKLKLAQFKGLNPENLEEVYYALVEDLNHSPYHEEIINTFVQVSEDYANQLIKESQPEKALEVLDSALVYSTQNKPLLYLKGVAYEKLKDFEQAYTLQSNYEPSLLELDEFKANLNYLKYRSYKNQIGISHLRSRFGDNYTISTISTVEYTRFEGKNTYIGRLNYAGRDSGKGIQAQVEWGRDWDEKTRTRVDLAYSNQFFPTLTANGSVYRNFNVLQGIEAELGLGYRKLVGGENLMNVVVGATKEMDPWRLNIRFNNFMLEGQYLYNVSGEARYYLSSPRNYIIAVGSFGSSPDVDLVDYQLFNGFSVMNSMVGAGMGHLLSKSVSIGALGTWNNYQTENEFYKNLYNIYLNLNVAF